MPDRFRPAPTINNESGFVLVLALMVLVMLSLFGAWALQTSDSETRIAGSLQKAERQFNVAEGASNTEAAALGFNKRDFYGISDPTKHNNALVPPTTDWNPGNDDTGASAGAAKADDPTTWPWRNLAVPDIGNTDIAKPAFNIYDYRYLVTYLAPDAPPMGYDQNMFSGYRFRIQGNTARARSVVELGGFKVGVKATL